MANKPRTKAKLPAAKITPEVRKNAARTITQPSLNAARVIHARSITVLDPKTGISHAPDISDLVDVLEARRKRIAGGDMTLPEGILISQTQALDSLFAQYVELARAQTGLAQFEAHMRVALKAQSQCRATVEALVVLKNPPVVYVRQANFANGPQQVNNGVPTRTRENEIEQTQLSGGNNELLPDARASTLAGGTDTSVEAMGKIDGAKVGRR